MLVIQVLQQIVVKACLNILLVCFLEKKDSAKAFEAIAASTSADAIAGIEIKKKEYIEPKIIIKARQKTLDEIIPDLPEISDEEYRKLEKNVRSDENYDKMFWGYMYTNPYETMGKRETQEILYNHIDTTLEVKLKPIFEALRRIKESYDDNVQTRENTIIT